MSAPDEPAGRTIATVRCSTSAHAGHGTGHPSDWLLRWQHLLAPGQTVLDLACGSGRHVRWLATLGLNVTAVDRDATALAGLSTLDHVTTLCADVEAAAWPLPGRQFDLVLVTNYLWRPLFDPLIDAVAPGGLLIYETFALGQEKVGRPSRPEFLLAPGELLVRVQPSLQVLGFEDGWSADDPVRRVQRVCAHRTTAIDPTAVVNASSEAATNSWPQSLRLPTFKPA